MSSRTLLLLAVVLAGCATLTRDALDAAHGVADPRRFDAPAAPGAGQPRWADVKPVLDRRCVVCHGCYDAPCQLRLTAWEAVARGANAEPVYDGGRLRAVPPTRLFEDARSASEWRAQGFFPVLNERRQTTDANLAAGVMARTLALKQAHPETGGGLLHESIDVSPDRRQQCPSIESFDRFETSYPRWGMPFGLPALQAGEAGVLMRWLAAGAPYEGEAPLSPAAAAFVSEWETFLNGDSPKERLMSRYLYEHLFTAHLYFEGDPARLPFRLVRSSSPPGRPVAPIATRRPYDDPGVDRVYYRLVRERETLLAKTHLPYTLGPSRMVKYRTWFLAPDYRVDTLPGYAPAVASNPFATFKALPVDSRYRFLLDEAQFFVMTFIKGPVCRGQLAVNVIQDRFWVFFADPRTDASVAAAEMLARESDDLRLPAEWGSNAPLLLHWRQYAELETRYLQTKTRQLEKAAGAAGAIDLAFIWDGDGRNDNAALTVFRHFDSATVVKGLAGEPPPTAWVIGYPMFERIYYLLVAGFDVYGNAGHQLTTRLYMDFLRMEGEFNFLLLLPQAERDRLRDRWYRGASDEVKQFVYGRKAHYDRETGIAFRTQDPRRELYAMLASRLGAVLDTRHSLERVADPALRRDLETLAAPRGRALSWLPEAVLLRVDDPPRPSAWFTLLRDTAHANVSHLVRERAQLLPDENALTLVTGFLGAYPNAIYRVHRNELPALTAAIRGLASESDYRALAGRFAVRRTHEGFWAASDALHDAYFAWAPGEAALFDYNRLENR